MNEARIVDISPMGAIACLLFVALLVASATRRKS